MLINGTILLVLVVKTESTVVSVWCRPPLPHQHMFTAETAFKYNCSSVSLCSHARNRTTRPLRFPFQVTNLGRRGHTHKCHTRKQTAIVCHTVCESVAVNLLAGWDCWPGFGISIRHYHKSRESSSRRRRMTVAIICGHGQIETQPRVCRCCQIWQ